MAANVADFTKQVRDKDNKLKECKMSSVKMTNELSHLPVDE